jgi:hypothetical protein
MSRLASPNDRGRERGCQGLLVLMVEGERGEPRYGHAVRVTNHCERAYAKKDDVLRGVNGVEGPCLNDGVSIGARQTRSPTIQGRKKETPNRPLVVRLNLGGRPNQHEIRLELVHISI